jgi:hypothetical protein
MSNWGILGGGGSLCVRTQSEIVVNIVNLFIKRQCSECESSEHTWKLQSLWYGFNFSNLIYGF